MENNDAANRLQNVRQQIQQTVEENGNGSQKVTLVAVSKTFSADAIEPVLRAGQRVFGENRVQEAAQKWPHLKRLFSDVKLHLIGPLQSNKTAAAVELFDCIETLDRPKLAKGLAIEMAKQDKVIELFVQVNTGAEPQKAGISVSDLSGFLNLCRVGLKLKITGLMCIPPIGENSEEHFSLLAAMAVENQLSSLSMGMSADYVTAIKCGATHVRVGSAIFGQR